MSRLRFISTLWVTALSISSGLYAQGYSGPSLLSRGGNSPGKRGQAPIDFNYYGAIRGTRDTGLIAARIDDSGDIVPVNTYGMQAELGAYGAKTWRRSSVGLDFRGDYRRYNQNQQFNGINQALALDYNFRVNRRITAFATLSGGTTNRAFGGFSAPAFANQDNFGVPLNEVFDARTIFAQLNGGLTYAKSARSSITVSGEGFMVKRRSRALIGVQGYRGTGTYEYRLTRSDGIGFEYNFISFTFPRIYGNSETHSATFIYTRRLNQKWDFRFNGGLYRVNTVGTQLVDLSPEVAAILGRTQGVEAFKRVIIQPQIELTTNYTLERSRFTASFQSGIGPGNGVYITSRQDGLTGGYSFSGTQRLSLGASVGYTRFHSLGLVLADYKTIQAGVGLNYKIAEHINFSSQFDRRKFDSPAVRGRDGTAITIGLSFSPARLPLPIW